MTTISATPERLQNLRAWNLALTALHLVQAIVIVLIAGNFAIDVTSTFPEGPPGTRIPLAEPLFGVRIGVVIGLFLLLAAIDHFVTATVARSTYESDLRSGINRFRWVSTRSAQPSWCCSFAHTQESPASPLSSASPERMLR